MSELLPHRAPMVLLEEAWRETDDLVHGKRTFRRGDFGVCGDLVCEPLLVECLAQLVGALRGLNARRSGGEPGQGFLVKVKAFEYHAPPPLDMPIELRAEITHRLGNFILAKVRASCDEQDIASGVLQFFIGELPNGKNGDGA